MAELPHVVFACLVVLVPILDRPLTRWLKESSDRMKRVKTYAGTIGFCFIMVALALVSMPQNLFVSPFERPNSVLQGAGWGLAIVLLAMTVYGPYALRVSEEQRKLAKVEFEKMSFFLPSTQLEKGWFAAVSVNAGFSEELLYRSFLIVYLDWLNPWMAAAFSALVFGLAHLYQGWKGALGTVMMAAMFTVIVAGTGSLVLAMVVHAIWDLRILFMNLDRVTRKPSVD